MEEYLPNNENNNPEQNQQQLPAARELTPREIVAELDKHIVGQEEAKRCVAVVVRNRYRRQQLDEKMRKNHIARVGKGKCDSKLTIPFNDVLHNIDRIGNSCVNLVEVAKENVTMQAFFAED